MQGRRNTRAVAGQARVYDLVDRRWVHGFPKAGRLFFQTPWPLTASFFSILRLENNGWAKVDLRMGQSLAATTIGPSVGWNVNRPERRAKRQKPFISYGS